MKVSVRGWPASLLAAIAGLFTCTVSHFAIATTAVPTKSAPAASATIKTPAKPATKAVAKAPAAKPKTSGGKHGPSIRSSAVLIVDESDSSVLLSKNADVAVPIASITKLMTALVVLDANLPLDEPIKITREDRAIDKGSTSALTVGAVLTRGELLHLALMSSENHAAHALGRTYEGGTKAIVAAMNTKAKVLGMKRTHFTDTTGLSSGNIASPEDLVRLVAAASENPVIRKYSTDADEIVQVGRYPVEYHSTNNLARKADWDIVVQKTGYTQAAGRCLVMKAIIDEKPVIMVLMNSYGKYTRTADAVRVRRWLEAAAQSATLAGR
jgi:serine-type D-Ala-D-Ala endopeptidase (penicillin-binding protein 7)